MGRVTVILFKITKFAALLILPFLLFFLGAFITMLIAIRGSDVTVPNVTGVELSRARKTLDSVQLRMNIAESRFSPTIPQGYVINQVPESGASVKTQSQVKLVLSEGKKKVQVPSLIGLTAAEALAALAKAGFKQGIVSYVHVLDSSREQVVDQFPEYGTTEVANPYIHLLLNAPADSGGFMMPDLAGLNANDVRTFLEENNFSLAPFEYETRLFQSANVVLSQKPSAGSSLHRSTSVELVVSR